MIAVSVDVHDDQSICGDGGGRGRGRGGCAVLWRLRQAGGGRTFFFFHRHHDRSKRGDGGDGGGDLCCVVEASWDSDNMRAGRDHVAGDFIVLRGPGKILDVLLEMRGKGQLLFAVVRGLRKRDGMSAVHKNDPGCVGGK